MRVAGLTLLLVLAPLAVSGSAPDAAAFGAPTLVATAAYAEPALALDPLDPDRIFVVTFSAQGSRAHRSEDGGASFAAGAPTPAKGGDADGIVLHGGALVVADLVDASGSFTVPVSRSLDGGASWATTVDVATPPAQDRHWLARGPNGEVYVKWFRSNADPRGFAVSRDGGLTFELKALSPAPSFSGPMVVGPDGTIHLATVAGATGAPLVRLFRSVDEGTTWMQSDVAPVTAHWASNVAVPQSFPMVAVNAEGRVAVTWTDYAGAAVAVSEDGGASFGPRRALTPPERFAMFPVPMVRRDGAILVAMYASDDPLLPDAKLPTTRWSLEVVEAADANAPWTRTVVDAVHRGSLCTQAAACPNVRVTATEAALGSLPGDRRLLDLFEAELDAQGRVHIAYARDRPGGVEVMHVRSAPGGAR